MWSVWWYVFYIICFKKRIFIFLLNIKRAMNSFWIACSTLRIELNSHLVVMELKMKCGKYLKKIIKFNILYFIKTLFILSMNFLWYYPKSSNPTAGNCFDIPSPDQWVNFYAILNRYFDTNEIILKNIFLILSNF